MLRSIVLVSVALLTVPAVAQDVTAPVADAAPVKEKKICRRETNIGSNIPHSTCHTHADWVEIDRTARDNAAQQVANANRNH